MLIDQRAVNPLDTAVIARLNENEAVMRTRVAEKKVQMAVSDQHTNEHSRCMIDWWVG